MLGSVNAGGVGVGGGDTSPPFCQGKEKGCRLEVLHTAAVCNFIEGGLGSSRGPQASRGWPGQKRDIYMPQSGGALYIGALLKRESEGKVPLSKHLEESVDTTRCFPRLEQDTAPLVHF